MEAAFSAAECEQILRDGATLPAGDAHTGGFDEKAVVAGDAIALARVTTVRWLPIDDDRFREQPAPHPLVTAACHGALPLCLAAAGP